MSPPSRSLFTALFLVSLLGSGLCADFVRQIGLALLDSVGSGHATLSLRADWQQHLAQTQSEIGFRQVRFHAILDDDMSSYLEGGANMFNVFRSYDALLELNIRPLVELSFMPRELALNSSNTVFHYEGGTSAPRDQARFGAFLVQFVGQLVQRYGIEEVSQWRFEAWNEPNCGFLFPYGNGCCEGTTCGSLPTYMQLYATIARAVKTVDQRLKVGGPATAQLGWIPEFLQQVKALGLPCDFISSHLYPTDPNVPAGRDGFARLVAERAGLAAQAGLPFLLTEFNPGLGINVADEPYSASFVVHQIVALASLAQQSPANVSAIETLSFWCFTDIFEEQGQLSPPYTQSFGMLTNYGVPKPVYRAFQMLASLPFRPTSDAQQPFFEAFANDSSVDIVSAIWSDQGKWKYATVATNYDLPGQGSAKTVELSFPVQPGCDFGGSLPRGLVETISRDSAYAKPVWLSAGSPTYPSRDEIKNELIASLPTQSIASLVVNNDRISYTVTLDIHETIKLSFQC
jgi:xylan 1,4-beta-xylosidase